MEWHTHWTPSGVSAPQAVVRLADPPRNGLPWARPYTWRPGEAERQAEVAARLAAIRARVNPAGYVRHASS